METETPTKGKILYAVAFNIFKHGRWWPCQPDYCKATSAAEAKNIVIRSYKERIDVIAAAPAVGYFVQDEKKVILSAT